MSATPTSPTPPRRSASDLTAERTIGWRRGALLTIAAFVFWTLGLMAAAPVHETAFAPGALRPSDETVVLRHFAGGDVAELFAAPNAMVRAGDPILRLDGRALKAELRQLETRRAFLELRRDRLSALLEERAFRPTPNAAARAVDRENAVRLFEAQRADDLNETASIDARMIERRASAAAAQATAKSIRAELAAYQAQLAISEELASRKVGTRRAVLDAEARIAEAEARIAELDGRSAALEGGLQQLVSERRQVRARRRADWSSELAETAGQLAEIDAALADARARFEALVLRAPIPGRVLELGAATAGDVIAPGGLAARIVPQSADAAASLVAEVRISPKDIGYIEVGDVAEVTVTAFDADAFGRIAGRVTELSPSSLTGEDGQPYFQGVLRIDRRSARFGDVDLQLAPGMVVQAKLATADTSLLAYLLEPVANALDVAFTER